MSIKSIKLTEDVSRDRESQKLETRRRILNAAIRVFARDGILAATSSAVAKEAGVSHGSVFVHFGTQNGLIGTAISSVGGSIAKRLHELASSGASSREVLLAHLDCLRENEDFYSRLVVETPLLSEEARSSLVMIQSAIAIHFFPALASDAAAGKIKELSPHLLFNTWIGLINHYLANRELFAPGTSVLDRRGEELLDHFMALIAKGD